MKRPQPPARVPTLTEVIALQAGAQAPAAAPESVDADAPVAGTAAPQNPEHVFADLKPWLDAEWDRRVHAALDPAWQSLHATLSLRLRAEFDSLLEEALRRALHRMRAPSDPG